MNRAELVETALYWDAVAELAAARAAAARQDLAEQAEKELEREGAAPTWRTGAGTVSLAVSRPSYVVRDEQEFMAWVADNAPSELEDVVQVRPAYRKRLLARAAELGDVPVDDGGQIIPGLAYVPGGAPKGIRILPDPEQKENLRKLADVFLEGGS